jgi:hypothetical protein
MIWISESKLRNIYSIELDVSSRIPWKFVLEALIVVVVVVVNLCDFHHGVISTL